MKSLLYPLLVFASFVIATFLVFQNLETVFADKLNTLVQYPWQFGALSTLLLASDLLLPVPSILVMYFNGYVLGTFSGTLVSLAGLMLGCVAGYYLGKMGSKKQSQVSTHRALLFLEKYGSLAILLSRGIPILSESICVVCGFNNMPFKHYLLYNLIGYLPLCVLYAYCGSIGYDQNNFMLTLGCSVLLGICFWFFGKKLTKPANA